MSSAESVLVSSAARVRNNSPQTRRHRKAVGRLLAALGVLALVVVGLGLAPASAQSVSDEQAFIAAVNRVRAGEGLPALIEDAQLRTLARDWTAEQQAGNCADGAFICHASPISAGVTHDWKKLGENVGTGPSVDAVMDAFVASPGHLANIVDPAFTHIGVGMSWDGNRLYTTHRFMQLRSDDTGESRAPATTAAPATTRAPATTAAAPTTTAESATTRAPATTDAAPATTRAPATTAAAPTTTAESATDADPGPAARAITTPATPETTDAPEPEAEDEGVDAETPLSPTGLSADRVTAILGAIEALSA